MSDGLAKSIEVLGARISSLESSESWLRQEADKAKKERDGYLSDVCRLSIEVSDLKKQCFEADKAKKERDGYLSDVCRLSIEVSDLKKQCFEANEKIREYERAVIIDNDGNLVQFKDLPEIEIPGEFEQEIRASLDRGKAPDKDTK